MKECTFSCKINFKENTLDWVLINILLRKYYVWTKKIVIIKKKNKNNWKKRNGKCIELICL